MKRLSCSRLALTALVLAILPLSGCATVPVTGPGPQDAGAVLSGWPQPSSPIARDAAMEARIAAIVAGMTLEQKIGQMTQAEIRWAKPDDVRRHYLGSILNGGGSWPDMNKRASLAEWTAMTRAFHDAAMQTDMAVRIPLIWGTDAVHGHNNVYGATLFPHNIGLGAAHDPQLVEEIARATAKASRATGISWIFAPTLAVVQDQRWGRTYESYSSDPELVRSYAAAAVRGLQGGLTGDGDVVATAKHFIGDGATFHGDDQGVARVPMAVLRDVHGAGYFAAVGAGVQTIMASYNSWTDPDTGVEHGKMHGNRMLLTGAIKERMGFDGFIVSDWNAIEQIPGCTKSHCPQAINAGIDMMMVPEDWRAFIDNTVADVRDGRIPISRIDDAVTRILRVKMRAGLFERQPAQGAFTGDHGALQARDLARRAVRKSLILLKNQDNVLPLARSGRVLVVGKNADSLANQSGGWSVTWQGTETTNADFGTGQTLLAALRETLGAENVDYRPTAAGIDLSRYAAVIAVIGETPYAEYNGDVDYPALLHHSARHPEDLALLQAVSGKGVPVVSVFYSGRAVYANDLINRSDAFVAAWLPGSEAGGIADVLLRDASGRVQHDFHGRLPVGWPAGPCSTSSGESTIFQRGYGLGYGSGGAVPTLPTRAAPPTCESSGG